MTHKIQIDDLVREATAEEIEIIKQRDAADQRYELTLEKIAAAKQSALNKLKTLGLTDSEIEALVGVSRA